MLISNLSSELQRLVHIRQKEQGNDGTFMGKLTTMPRDGNFSWGKDCGDEEQWFWNHIDKGLPPEQHPMYQQLIAHSYELY